MFIFLNWLWQGAVIALATAALLRVIPSSLARARYWAVGAAFVAVFALPAIPFVLAALSPLSVASNQPVPIGVEVPMPIAWLGWTTLAAGLWTVWIGLHAFRLAAASLALRKAKQQCSAFPREVAARLHHWSRVSTSGRRARLMISDRVRSAAVLGSHPPVIAVAPALLDHLDPS